MAADQAHKPRSELGPEQQARIEAARAQCNTPEFRAEEARVRGILDREYRETGTIATTGEATTLEDLTAFRRFAMSLRGERERQGLSLADLANRSQIDPTLSTLARHARALGERIVLTLVG